MNANRGIGVVLQILCSLGLSDEGLCQEEWTEQVKLVESPAWVRNAFGIVAADGDTLVVGSYGGDSVTVFVRNGTSWIEEAQLEGWNLASDQRFGAAGSLSGDTLLVGAPILSSPRRGFSISSGAGMAGFARDAAGITTGAYVLERSGTTWVRQAKLIPSDSEPSFGLSVSVSGSTAVIGGEGNAAYVFVRTGAAWTQQARLIASDAAAGDGFGTSVSVSGDTILIGAPWDDTDAGEDAGSAYVFTRSGEVWSEQAKLATSAPNHNSYDEFGYAVALSQDTALVGAPLYGFSPNGGYDGAAFAFVKSGTSWTEEGTLLSDEDGLGWSVALSGDRALVGAPVSNVFSSNAAYLFERTGSTWARRARLISSDRDREDYLGWSVAISENIAVVGAPSDDHSGAEDEGSAYVYDLAPATAASFNGDGINVDLLDAGPMIAGAPWSSVVTLGHTHGASGALLLRVKTTIVSGSNFLSGGHQSQFLIAGPLLSSIVGTHDGLTGSFAPQPVPSSLTGTPWAAQAMVIGGGFADLSSARYGIVGR